MTLIPQLGLWNCSLEVQTFGNHRSPLYGENILEFLKKINFFATEAKKT